MQPGGMTLCKAESAASARQKNYVRGAALPLRFPSLTSLFVCILFLRVNCSIPYRQNVEAIQPRGGGEPGGCTTPRPYRFADR